VIARTPSLTGVRVDGSGEMTVPELDGGRFEVEVNGSADVRAEGRVEQLAASVDGSGDLDLGDLVAGSARLDIAGSGDADVDAERRLEVTLSGSGDVHYAGDPILAGYISGSGEVMRG